MNQIAEIGVAAHWIYKEESDQLVQKAQILEKFAWIRDMIEELGNDNKNPEEFMSMLKIDLFHDEIFVFTPEGDVIQLVEDATEINDEIIEELKKWLKIEITLDLRVFFT